RLQQEGGDLDADLEFIVAEGGERGRHHNEGTQGTYQHRRGPDQQRRPGEGGGRHGGGAHYRQLPVAGEPRIDEQHDDEAGDRQDRGDETGHQQHGQAQENERRKPVADNDLDETQRLGEPDQGDQPGRHQEQRHQQLAENI